MSDQSKTVIAQSDEPTGKPYDEPKHAPKFSLYAGVNVGVSSLEFLAIRGRTYSIQASTNFQQWNPVSFKVVTGGVAGALQSGYQATDVRTLQIQVPFQAGITNRYFRAVVQ